MKASDALVNMLEQVGVEVIFGLCGDTSLPFYDSLYKKQSDLKHILTRDERSASYMADAYARISGKVGVCEGPSGGGVTYIIPGVAEANQSSVPMVVFTSDINTRDRGRGTLTELDQTAIFSPLTLWTQTPAHGAQFPWTIREAFRRATTGRLGAVHVGLPFDIQQSDVPDSDVYIDSRYTHYPAGRAAPDPAAVRNAANLLSESSSPVIVAGAGVLRSGAWTELESLAELLGCPVATSISGKGAVPETHPYALGVVGSNGGLAYRHEFIKRADLVFFVGCHTGSVTTDKWTLPIDGSTNVIQLDVEASRIGLNYRVVQGIVADAKLGVAALVDEIGDRMSGISMTKVDPEVIAEKRESQMTQIAEFDSDAVPIRPERFVTELSRVLPDEAIILADPGTPTPYLAAYLRLSRAGRWFVAPRAHGALGYALPAVVGAYQARPQSKIFGVMGDGGFGMSAGELETIVRLKLPVVLIVLANSSYGWIKAGQKARGDNYFGVDFSNINHAQVARAYGLEGIRVEDPAQLKTALQEAADSKSPILVEVVTQPLQEAKAPVSKWIA